MTHYNHNGLFAASFFIRIIAYIFGFLFFYLIIVGALIMNPQNQPPFSSGSALIDGSLLILTVASPFIFTEYRIRKNRRKLGLSIYKNVTGDLLYMEAQKNSGLENKSYDSNKHDLNYWYELKEKGAITQEEYESKKRELLK